MLLLSSDRKSAIENKNRNWLRRAKMATWAMNQAKFPYDYKSVRLNNGGHATFIGEPSKEILEAINNLAELAYKKLPPF